MLAAAMHQTMWVAGSVSQLVRYTESGVLPVRSPARKSAMRMESKI
jgi:hypothetical protein